MLSVRRTRGHRVFEEASLGLDALVRFGDGNCVVADFPFGTEFKADFVALAPFSGGWEIHFVDLEPPDVHLFNLDGAAAKSLNRAITQVSEWRTFIEKNRPTVLRDLTRFAKERDLIRGPRKEEPTFAEKLKRAVRERSAMGDEQAEKERDRYRKLLRRERTQSE